MYKVILKFKDLKTGHVYEVGDTFPHKGKVTKKRLNELSTKNNKLNKPLIEEIVEDVKEVEEVKEEETKADNEEE